MTKDELKNLISMALKDPTLQQGFEIICRELADLQKEVIDLRRDKEDLIFVRNAKADHINELKEQIVKLEKVDDKTAYENLLVKYAELENKIADIKANCDLAIEGREVKIKELEDHLAEEVELHLHAEEYTKSLEQQIEEMKTIIKKKYCKKCPYRKDNEMFLKIAYDENKKLKEHIEKMKCCGNCNWNWSCTSKKGKACEEWDLWEIKE